MGNGQSSFNQSHVRIYKNLLQIQNPMTRAEIIRTLMAGQEYVASARGAGIYAHLLAYIARVEAGQRPAALPGEIAMTAVVQPQQVAQQSPQRPPHLPSQQLTIPDQVRPTIQQRPHQQIVKGRRNEKALNYFQNCLLVLGLEEEIALTEDVLKKAYKKAAIRSHPDKGGSEEEFEAVTRAHAYLGDILRRIKGGRAAEGKMEAPEALKDNRATQSKEWEIVQPVRLNPKKLDLNAFNQMFEQTRIPDPEDEGYGDWLKSAEGAESGPKFGGKFNRDVFNQMFEEEAQKRRSDSTELAVRQPEALIMSPTMGVELGRGGGGDYTAPINSNLKYTDLKSAYTKENLISNQIVGARVENRSFEQVSASRKAAPEPLRNEELAAIQAAEAATARREEQRRLRAAQEDTVANQYFERMKRLVITNK